MICVIYSINTFFPQMSDISKRKQKYLINWKHNTTETIKILIF